MHLSPRWVKLQSQRPLRNEQVTKIMHLEKNFQKTGIIQAVYGS